MTRIDPMKINAEIIQNLRKEYGDAFYLLDSEQFKSNFQELKSAFQKYYSNFNIAYSYKTNYTPKLCRIVNELGGYAEVVSEMELEIALKVGVNYDHIIWNGPIKTPEILEDFLIKGGACNIDSIDELSIVKEIVKRHPQATFNLGIRCNYNVADGVVSRFGFDIDSDDFNEVLNFIVTTSNVVFRNLQCHFAKRQIDYWPARAQGMISLINRIGIIPPRIDIGGGLFGKMDNELKAQFANPIPSYEDYAKSVAPLFAEYFKEKSVKPELIIEPGSALVGDCMKFVGTVKTIKNIRGKYFATILGSQKNISMSGVNPPLKVISMGINVEEEYRNLDMVGFTCIEGDVLYHDYNGPLAIGDAVIFSNCGSYSLVMKPPFILPNFPVLDICSGKTEVIKRAENFDDLFHTFKF